jgi:hypothetical protein
MNDTETLTQQLRARLAAADHLADRYQRALRRDLIAWIVIAATLGCLVGYGVAASLIDPMTVLVPCEEGVRA